ncbi:MAG TPA: hypothetical protein VFL93_15150 [Longimicrobiaceae bacterium]|nr:hypothetical protein [Longimicrobiaceae bacterium]
MSEDRDELRARVEALPREIEPPHDLWPGIAARLHESARPSRAGIATPLRRSWVRNPVWLAAAAVLLVMLASGLTALALRRGAPAPLALTPAAHLPAGLAAFHGSDGQYRAAVEQLQADFEARRDRLSPATVATIEKNLKIIDQAIAESRAALAADPNNADLPLMLSGVYQTKLELLQKAVRISSRT